jgi:hypothetical protein
MQAAIESEAVGKSSSTGRIDSTAKKLQRARGNYSGNFEA